MKLRNFVLTLTVASLLPVFAHAADPVAASFDRAFINGSFLDAGRDKADQVVTSFDRAFGKDAIVQAYRTKSDQVAASFERELKHDPIVVKTMLARADGDVLDAINAVLRGDAGKSKVQTAIIESNRHGG